MIRGCSNDSAIPLSKPFKCPNPAERTAASAKPLRKRRKVSYAGADEAGVDEEDYRRPWTKEERHALANKDVNKWGTFTVKDTDSTFKQRFSVPLVDKNSRYHDRERTAPILGMRDGTSFVVKPLHDPCGEFAIVLYDPTVDERPSPSQQITEQEKQQEKEKLELDAPIVHKSLTDILGIKKKVNEGRPKVPVVIDPRLAKMLRPHQVEGVKVCPAGVFPPLLRIKY